MGKAPPPGRLVLVGLGLGGAAGAGGVIDPGDTGGVTEADPGVADGVTAGARCSQEATASVTSAATTSDVRVRMSGLSSMRGARGHGV